MTSSVEERGSSAAAEGAHSGSSVSGGGRTTGHTESGGAMSTRPTPVSNGGTSAERMLDEIRQVFHTLASHLPLEITPKRATHFFQGITEITCALVNTQKLLDELVNSINDGGEPWPELERARSVLALLEVHTNG